MRCGSARPPPSRAATDVAAVLAGAHTHVLLEDAGEVALVHKTRLTRNGGQRHGRVGETAAGVLHAVAPRRPRVGQPYRRIRRIPLLPRLRPGATGPRGSPRQLGDR